MNMYNDIIMKLFWKYTWVWLGVSRDILWFDGPKVANLHKIQGIMTPKVKVMVIG